MKPDKSALTEAEREDLVAYLDNELEEPRARAIETKLNLDPSVRAEAEQMKRAWELLDYLPHAEPKPGFTSRTMDHLTALRPIDIRARRWKRVLAWAAAFLCVAACGFAAGWLFDRPDKSAATTDQDIAANWRLLQHLPTYKWIEDLGDVDYLAQPELFGDDLSGGPPRIEIRVASASGEAAQKDRSEVASLASTNADEYAALKERLREFHRLPENRQQAIRKLDRQLNQEHDTATRAREWRVLARYTQWVGQLPIEDQQRLKNANREERQRMVRELRDRDWLIRQPQPVQDRVAALSSDKEKAEEVARLRKEERAFRLAWAERYRTDSDQPSPLQPGHLPLDAQSFIHDRLKPMLTPSDYQEFDAAFHKGGGRYIRTLLKLTERYAPASAGAPIPYNPTMLQQSLDKGDLKKKLREGSDDKPEIKALKDAQGKWPDFGIAAIAFIRQYHPKAPLPAWAHAKPSDFEPAVQTFLDSQLRPVLTPDEKKQLDQAEGQWPDYHRTLMKLAQDHGLSVPGMSLPGNREFWDRLAVALPEQPDHVLIEFASKLSDKELAGVQFSLTDRASREKLKEEYYRRNPQILEQRLLEDYQAWQRKN